MPRLRVVRGSRAGETHVLPVWAVVLGRDEACDLVVDDDRASRQHACIRIQHEHWTIRDLESANGTFLDGERVRDWTQLADRAEIRIGRTILRFEDDETPAPSTAPIAASVAAAAAAAQPVLPRFPGHETLEVAGRGATGTVYRARQLSLDRIVAIKRLSSRFSAQPEAVERFDREARAAAALSHPHVVQIFDVAHALVDGRMRHWFTMEFMEGGTVEDRLLAAPSAKLPWREAVRIVADAAQGLAHLHAHGLVHRDVKPANLFLDRRGEVKLGDLGTLVRADEAAGERIGTPHYMSPEQAERRPVTRASDVYSLGATLYRMLTGSTPHHGKDVREIIERVATATPVAVEQDCPGLPPAVGLLVRQMMARDAAARPGDTAELGDRLSATLAAAPEPKRSLRRVRSSRWSVTGWILGLAIAGGTCWALLHPDQVRAYLAQAEAALNDARSGAPSGASGRGDEPPRDDAAAARDAAGRVAAETFDEIRRREDALGPPSGENAEARLRVADDYTRMTEVFPITCEAVVRAHWRARELRDVVARLTGGDAANSEFADRWVERALRDQPRAPAEAPSAAATSPAPSKPPVPTAGAPGETPGARPTAPAPDGSVASIRAARLAVLAQADALAARRRVREAMDLVLDWMRGQLVAAFERQAPGEVHEEISKCKEWVRLTARTASARLESDLAGDRALLRTHLAATAVLDGVKVRRAPAAALESLDALEPLLVTGPGKGLARTRRAQLAAMSTDWRANAAGVEKAMADALRAAKDGGAPPQEGTLWLAIEAGRAEAAARLLDLLPGLTADRRAAAQAEIAAIRARPASGDAASLDAWRKAHAGTVAVLLVPGGASAPVFATDDTDRWYESWGADPE